MPTQREWRERDAAAVDADLIGRAATWLRTAEHRVVAGLTDDRVAGALAELLDALGDGVAGLHAGVRWQAVQSCRVVVGEPMASPTVRRTRRRR
jgi:hypothetical protein